MASLRAEIGPLSSLFAFEAAGRLGSFTRAADELGVTQAAVSKQIVALEDWTGQRLFHRKPRHVELTEAGQALFSATTVGLGTIARSMRDLQEVDERPLTLALTIPLSQLWLMPRLKEFTAAYPDIALKVDAKDPRDTAVTADFTILFHPNGNALPQGCRHLFGGEVRAMASRAFLARHRLQTPSDVLRAPLIQYDAPDRSWLTWRDWAVEAGIDSGRLHPALSVSRYEDALIAARTHQGAVLVWFINGQPLISGEELEPLPGPILTAPGAFYLQAGPLRPGAEAVLDWLIRLSGGATRPMVR